MIKHYTDHAANERTYLAWIRTSIAIMGFGFIIEKFEIYISQIAIGIENEKHLQASLSAELVGLGLFLIGIFIIVIATWRFFMFKEAIDAEDTIPYSVKKTTIILSVLITLMALFLFFYMGNQIFSQ